MKRILYVEDDQINQLILRKYLQHTYTVVMASSSKEALECLENEAFDLVLLDINLGPDEMNGIELLKHIRASQKYKGTLPFFAISAYSDKDDIDQLLEAGFDHFHPKPFEREKLMQQLEAVL